MQFSNNNSGASKVRIGATYANRVALAKELRERAFSKKTPTNLDTELSGLRQIPEIDALSRVGEYFRQNYVGPTSYATPRYAMGGARGGMTVSPQGSISNFIQKAGDEFVRSNAESIGQVSNEYFNQQPYGQLLGKDFLANAVGRVNSGFGESMRGKVTPMDIANVASFAPIPAGAAAKGALMAGKLLGPTAERLAVPVLKNAYEPLGALVNGGSTTRESLGRGLASLLDSTGARVGGNAARVAEQGSNVSYIKQDTFEHRNDPQIKTSSRSRTGPGSIRNAARETHKQRLIRRIEYLIEKGLLPEGTRVRKSGELADSTTREIDFPSTKEVREMADAFENNPLNKPYMDAAGRNEIEFLKPQDANNLGAVDQQLGKFTIFGHKPGTSLNDSIINNLSNAPDHLVSGELNDIELAATRAGNNFKTYKEVMKWAMTNVSKFEGFNLDQMIERLGVPTKYWD